MTVRPIIFSAPMIRALLDDRKGQTRRVLKSVPEAPSMTNIVHDATHSAPYLDAYCGGARSSDNPRGMTDRWCWWTRDNRPGPLFRVGYVPGDLLYVREALRRNPDLWRYEADDTEVGWPGRGDLAHRQRDYLAARFMPRNCSRLTLKVTGVKVERVQDISAADSIQEGVECDSCVAMGASACNRRGCFATLQEFQRLWNSINGKKPGCSWEDNPWCCCLTFKTIKANVDTVATDA